MSTFLLENRRARHDYEYIETVEAGIELFGFEVKSLRGSHGSLAGSYIIIRGNEAYISGMTISPYKTQSKSSIEKYDQKRLRKLLLKKKEIVRLATLEKDKGLTLVPILVYNKKRFIKVSVALARGKNKRDKREVIKKRDSEKEMRRILKGER